MLKWKVRRTIDLSEDALPVERLKALATLSSRIAHELRIHIQESKKDADLGGLSVKLSVILPDKSSLMDAFDGAVEGNTAVMTLPDICYSQAGEVRGVLYLADASGGLLPVYAFVLLNFSDLTDIFIDTSNVVPSISELLAQMQTMREVTKNAQDAVDAATTAASVANTAASNANEKAAAADTAAKGASGWANATMTAKGLPTGSAPTADITTADDWHKIITLGIPRGATGATPKISVEVLTGAAGSDASVSVSGTAENPVIHFTIPRGNTGAIENLTINGKTTDADGNVTIDASDITYGEDTVAWALGRTIGITLDDDGRGTITFEEGSA